jgi:capsular exopolysaccharide synthesis family protein
VEDLSLLACGYAVSNPAEVLNSREFARILSDLAGTYDRVLVDAPPVTVVTDAQILGAICDYAILVLKADKSTRRVARRAIEALESVGTELLGTVVNEVKKRGGRYGYYGRYASSYRTGSNDGGSKKKEGVRADPSACRPITRMESRSEA